MHKFYKLLFFLSTLISTLISISSNSWLISWIGLEINLLSIMPLMKLSNNKFSSETMIKYFIIQSLSSMLLLFTILTSMNSFFFFMYNSQMIFYMMSISLLMKMGAAPFHFWFPEVMSNLKWNIFYLILTWQKISPFILLSYLNYKIEFLVIFIILSAFTGSILGLNMLCIRKLLSYSSINHISWMLISLLNYKIWLFYFLTYSIMNFFIIIYLMKFNIYYMNQSNFMLNNNYMNLLFSLNLLSLGGLPPFIGFFPKWITINLLINNNLFYLSILMIMSTLINLFFYIRLIIPLMLLNNSFFSSMKFNKMNMNLYFIILMNLTFLFSLMIYTILFLIIT
uniref:NADH dehydrogenase subunit 2 n=1 Tax=Scolytoplatypus wugongshanensis TaxID=2894162 RepID=UPI0023AA71BB|nr:NADH dehydrogenase subunit 2 [Scolytoplatypus wugongshanensis]WCB99735.1 NADH dehydrogenase subunit 2 [Scolytoplatypus wugongshanensis]